jgi:hypothetical protein
MNVMARSTLASREDILVQIGAILAAIAGVKTFCRNRGEMSDVELPAIIMLDGREDIVDNRVAQMKSVKMPPAVFRLQPQIFVILRQRDDATNLTLDGEDAPIGPELSYWRDAVLAALINDPVLIEMLTTTGQVVFRAMETDMQTGGTMQGMMRLSIDFNYVWQPAQA